LKQSWRAVWGRALGVRLKEKMHQEITCMFALTVRFLIYDVLGYNFYSYQWKYYRSLFASA
jgi:hypothetical protein